MNRIIKIATGVAIALVVLYLVYFFIEIVIYILIAGVLSFMGHPLVRILDRIRIRHFAFPHLLSVIITLLVIISFVAGFFTLLVPVISRQAEVISHIDIPTIINSLTKEFANLEDFLHKYRFLRDDESLALIVNRELTSMINVVSFADVFQNIVAIAGSMFIGIFSVIFLTFFFLRDDHMFYNGIILFVPEKWEEKGRKILGDTRRLLSRYFLGLCVEITLVGAAIYLLLTIFGIENALLIGFLGGLLKIVPYLGPIIGTILGTSIAITNVLSTGNYDLIVSNSLTVITVFVVCNMLDDFIFQPWIYSGSVMAHPIEILLVILMAGSLAGIPGMILAIPSYTVIRIVAKQFFSQYKLVKKLTEKI